MKPGIRKLLVVALKPEWSFLKQKFDFIQDERLKNLYHIKECPGAALLQIGVGVEVAQKHFLQYLEQEACHSVFHFGVSGALDPSLKTGDLVLVTEIVCDEFVVGANPGIRPQYNLIDGRLHGIAPTKANIVCGKLFTSPTGLTCRAEKKAVADQTGAIAVDMESFVVARLCQEHGIAYQAVRGIYDTFEENIEDLDVPATETGDISAAKMVVNILKDPKLVLKLPALKKRLGLVNRGMGQVIEEYLSA